MARGGYLSGGGLAVVACWAVLGCGGHTGAVAEPTVQETPLTREQASAALLEPAEFGRGFRRVPSSNAEWRYVWSGRETSWKCHHALGRLAQADDVSGSAVTLAANDRTSEVGANEVVSFESAAAARSAFSSLRRVMSECTHDRGIELTGSEGVTELRIRTGYGDGGTSDEHLDVRAEGRLSYMGGSDAVAWDATVARTGNHLTSVHSYPGRGTPSRADRVSDLLQRSLERLSAVSNGQTPSDP